MKPEWIVLESSLAGTHLKASGQQRLSSRKMQRTTADRCLLPDGNSDMGGIISLRAVTLSG